MFASWADGIVIIDTFEVNSSTEGKEGGSPVQGAEVGIVDNPALKGRLCDRAGKLNAFSRASGAGVVEGTWRGHSISSFDECGPWKIYFESVL